jgi:hypothetical protein
MTINYTTLLGLAKPVTGTESGAWGDVVNDQITSLVEDSIANAASINVTSGNVTLTDNNGTSDQARMAILLVSGTPGTSRNIVAPSTSKWYIVRNGSNDAVVIKGSATTGVTIPTGSEALVFWNGSDFEVGGMAGPTSSTDNAVVRYDGTTGKLVQNSSVTIDDSNNVGGLANLNFSGTGNRITGDFSNATLANRVLFQSSTTNGNTGLGILPNGTATASGIRMFSSSDSGNASIFNLAVDPSVVTIDAATSGTGTYLPLAFYTGGSERVRIDTSGNVGIGTSSPGVKLHVNSGATDEVARFEGTGEPFISLYDNGVRDFYLFDSAEIRLWGQANKAMVFATNNAERMRIDSSGNVGIGSVSPDVKLRVDATSPTRGIVETIRGTGSTGSQLHFSQDAVADWVIGQPAGVSAFAFFSGRSLGADGTERMRIDSSGNVGIGTSSPSYRLTIAGNGGSGLCTLAFVDTSNANKEWRIDQSSGALRFTESGAAERMRIDSSGNLLVGDTTHPTSSDNRLAVVGTRGIDCKNTGGATAPNITSWNNATTGDNIFVSFRTETADTARGSISYNRAGGLVAYNTTSDYRAKDILGPVANPGTTIDALKVYTGKMKGATVERPMLVAHEAQEVTPYAVTGEKDASNEDGSPKYQQMDVASLVPLLIAEIQSLRARVAQLEGA